MKFSICELFLQPEPIPVISHLPSCCKTFFKQLFDYHLKQGLNYEAA
jgi:hypothetical protein